MLNLRIDASLFDAFDNDDDRFIMGTNGGPISESSVQHLIGPDDKLIMSTDAMVDAAETILTTGNDIVVRGTMLCLALDDAQVTHDIHDPQRIRNENRSAGVLF